MTVSDLQADSLVNPTCFKVRIKCSKTDPFRAGCDIYLGRGVDSVCPIVALGNYLTQRGSTPGPLFMFSNGRPLTRQHVVFLDAVDFTRSGLLWLVLWPQLPDWGSNYGSCPWCSRSSYQDLRALVQWCIPDLYPYSS